MLVSEPAVTADRIERSSRCRERDRPGPIQSIPPRQLADRHHDRDMVRRLAPTAAVTVHPRLAERADERRASPKYDRGGGRDPKLPSRGHGSSTKCTGAPAAARSAAPRRRKPPAFCNRPSRSTSTGVWLTTLRSCLCDHTSVSNGAMLRSPTAIIGRPSCRSAANHAVSSSRNCSLWANFGFASGSGKSPPAGT